MEVTRRQLIAGSAALVLLPRIAIAANQHDGVGILDKGVFHWTNGGGNPYKGTLAEAMELAGVPQNMRSRIEAEVAAHPRGHQSYTLQDGDRVGVMVFTRKKHWVAKETVAMPSKWKSGASREASVWYVTTPELAQWRIMKPKVCGNWSFDDFGAAVLCPRCDVSQGDAC